MAAVAPTWAVTETVDIGLGQLEVIAVGDGVDATNTLELDLDRTSGGVLLFALKSITQLVTQSYLPLPRKRNWSVRVETDAPFQQRKVIIT